MKHISPKQVDDIRDVFVRNLAVDFFEADEIEHILKEIDAFDPLVRQKILALCLALSHASSSMVPRVLGRIKTASETLLPEDLDLWVGTAFDYLDGKGIDAALAFMARTGETDLKEFQAPAGLRLREAAARLEIYLRGLSGLDLKVGSSDEPYTDTMTVHLPARQAQFPDHEDNLLLYQLEAAVQWAQIHLGTVTLDAPLEILRTLRPEYSLDHADGDAFFSLFAQRNLAIDLYGMLEGFRHESFLRQELPGLMRRTERIRRALFDARPALQDLDERSASIEALYQYFLSHTTKGSPPAALAALLPRLSELRHAHGPEASLALLNDAYESVSVLSGTYTPRALPLMPKIRPDKVSQALARLRQIRKHRISGMLAKLAELPDLIPPRAAAGTRPAAERRLEPDREYLLIKGRLIELDRDLRDALDERGGMPGGLLVTGSDMGSGSPLTLAELLDDEQAEGTAGGVRYDEWDYKRGDYRKNWCSLYVQDVPPGHAPFVEATLKRYGGYVTMLRKKFELLKREPRIQRRQKEGDDIDIDAVVEAFADLHAGLSPADNLFTKLDRQERNIAVLFLIDMSGSTKGWVNTAEKESLVLMCEALETLGDRYAIYGFSGMTRNRCDLFRVKGFDEPYAESVKRRIAGIEPKDYTRMGPFLRHAVMLLRGEEARTRLLITLSDGKPEDWDAYKGDYGIEDTRRALIEAREQGIHPFCITIDKEAQTYLPHMYGAANYIFISDVRQLPNRMTEIYRRLTS